MRRERRVQAHVFRIKDSQGDSQSGRRCREQVGYPDRYGNLRRGMPCVAAGKLALPAIALTLGCGMAACAYAAEEFRPTIENMAAPPAAAPAGMVWIPGGEFSMGAGQPADADDVVGMQSTKDSRPVHRVY